VQGKLGIVTETAPASDTASSGLNGRLQRVAQRLTSLIALLPTSLGTKTAANSLSVVQASDDPSAQLVPATGIAIADTGTKTASFNGASQVAPNGARGRAVEVFLGTVSGTTPTLSITLQYNLDPALGSSNWRTVSNATTNLTASSQALMIYVYPGDLTNAVSGFTTTQANRTVLAKNWRLVYTIGGTTPSFGISAVNVAYVA
jgi:hypothetical protein